MQKQRLTRAQRSSAGYRRGSRAELWAAAWLSLKGYRILARRWRCHAGEIDLVAWRRGVLVAVEVKARPTLASGLESIRPAQQARLNAALAHFLAQRHLPAHTVRLDALVIRPWRLPHHLPDAWRA